LQKRLSGGGGVVKLWLLVLYAVFMQPDPDPPGIRKSLDTAELYPDPKIISDLALDPNYCENNYLPRLRANLGLKINHTFVKLLDFYELIWLKQVFLFVYELF
jgi:hypothetical protein